jgi:membrane protease YdiL (CAAX protease family)
MLHQLSHPLVILAALLTLVPYFSAAFCPRSLDLVFRLPIRLRILAPALLGLPYALVSLSTGLFRWPWLALYTLLPVGISLLLYEASLADPAQRGGWRDFLVLVSLGLAIDLRWFEPAWGPGLAVFNKMLLLDAGIYGFLAIRQLRQVGFDLRLRLHDFAVGLFALAAYTPIAVTIGLFLGFLHFHALIPSVWRAVLAWLFSFFFVAVPEELFFRGWMQNLLERRVGPARALLITAGLFGLSHFNKRAAVFNWRYVLLAALAGIFYGLAWRQERRVGASAITHASVDTIWGIWLR